MPKLFEPHGDLQKIQAERLIHFALPVLDGLFATVTQDHLVEQQDVQTVQAVLEGLALAKVMPFDPLSFDDPGPYVPEVVARSCYFYATNPDLLHVVVLPFLFLLLLAPPAVLDSYWTSAVILD